MDANFEENSRLAPIVLHSRVMSSSATIPVRARRVLLQGVLGALASVAIGCGGGGGEAPDAGAIADAAPPDALPALTLDDMCDADRGGMIEFMSRLFTCYPEFAILTGEVPSKDEMSKSCYGQFQDYFDDGTVDFGDRADWARCLDYIRNTPCDELTADNPVACRDALRGNQGDGGVCDIDEQCPKNAYCDKSAGETCGACKMGLANGQTCDGNDACASGNCVGDKADGVGTCEFFGGAGSTCEEDFDCLGRLVCDPETLQCAAQSSYTVGDSCTAFETGCGFPLGDVYCNTALGTCVAYLEIGDDCAADQGICRFVEYQWCDTAGTGKCTAPSTVGDGAPCSMGSGTRCGPGLRCDKPFDPGGRCYVPLTEGKPCSDVNNRCGFAMECLNARCAYADYTGMCPAAP